MQFHQQWSQKFNLVHQTVSPHERVGSEDEAILFCELIVTGLSKLCGVLTVHVDTLSTIIPKHDKYIHVYISTVWHTQ